MEVSLLNFKISMVSIRSINTNDLKAYEHWCQPMHAYHTFDGPYYPKKSSDEISIFIHELKEKLQLREDALPQRKMIVDPNGNLLGEVSYTWRSKETNWMEIGIVIFDESYWGRGLGTQALKLWITELFKEHAEIVRIGFSTWSGNLGMVKLAAKLGMKQEACYQNARIVRGQYYDSVSFGLLRDEW